MKSIKTKKTTRTKTIPEYFAEMEDKIKSELNNEICRACGTLQCRKKDLSNVMLLKERRDDITSRILSKKRKRLEAKLKEMKNMILITKRQEHSKLVDALKVYR